MIQPHPVRLPLVREVVLSCLGMMVIGYASPAFAEGYANWQQLESAEGTQGYTRQIGEKGFEAEQQNYLESTILPQLSLEANRSTIVQVRQRMRDIITRGTTAPKVFDAANAVARGFMVRVAQDDTLDLVVRVNAMILVGELLAADRKPWAGSVKDLAKAATDTKLPLAVRIAAMHGLVAQVAGGRGSDPAFAEVVGPAMASLVTSPPEGDPAAVAWIVGRAIEIVPVAGGSPEVIASVSKILADEKADIDFRIRAATTLGRVVQPDSAAAIAPAIDQIRTLAAVALQRDVTAAEARRFARRLGSLGTNNADMLPVAAPPPLPAAAPAGGDDLFGLGGPGAAFEGAQAMPTVFDPDAVPPQACRRNAWRLMTLAAAIKPEGSGRGGMAAALTGDAAAAAIELATILRREGKAITTQPDEASLKTALAAIGVGPKPAVEGGPSAAPAPGPTFPDSGPSASPSPF